MTEYTTKKSITVPGGTVMRLSRTQISDRGRRLKALDEAGLCEVVETIEFKAGETISVEGDLGRATMAQLEPVPPAAAGSPSSAAAGDGARSAPPARAIKSGGGRPAKGAEGPAASEDQD